MNMHHTLLKTCVGLLLLAVMIGCGKEADAPTSDGPMERTGEKIDEGAEKTGEAIDRGVEKTGEKIEDAGRKMQE